MLCLMMHHYSAFLACSRNCGAVPEPFSMSAAQRAAPHVFVKEKKMPTMGTISSRTLVTPKLQSQKSA